MEELLKTMAILFADKLSGKQAVSVAKAIHKAAAKYLEPSSNASSDATATSPRHSLTQDQISSLNSIHSRLITITISSDVVHDAFFDTFEILLEVLHSFSLWNWLHAISMIELLLEGITSCKVDSSFELKRLESLVNMLAGIFGSATEFNHKYDNEDAGVKIKIMDKVNSTMETLAALQGRMKTSLSTIQSSTHTATATSKAKLQKLKSNLKEIRSACSSVRKACISCVDSTLHAVPEWIRENSREYLKLCVSTLSTPLLFTVGYKMVKDDDKLTSCIVLILHQSLANIQGYSLSAACDIITAISDLCRAGCQELVLHNISSTSSSLSSTSTTQSFMETALKAYCTFPRSPAPPSSSSSSSAAAAASKNKGDATSNPTTTTTTTNNAEDTVNWKIICGGMLKECITLAKTTTTTTTTTTAMNVTDNTWFGHQFQKDLLDTLCFDIMSLHKALGTTSLNQDEGTSSLPSTVPANVFSLPLETNVDNASHSQLKDSLTLSKEGLRERFGTTDVDEMVAILLTTMGILGAYLGTSTASSTPTTSIQIVEGIDRLQQLMQFLHKMSHRKIVFDDDMVLLCTEVNLCAKIDFIVGMHALQKKKEKEGKRGGKEGKGDKKVSSHFTLTPLTVLQHCTAQKSTSSMPARGTDTGTDTDTDPYAGYNSLIYEAAKDAMLNLADQVCSINAKNVPGQEGVDSASFYKKHFGDLEASISSFSGVGVGVGVGAVASTSSLDDQVEKIANMFDNAMNLTL